ncbi:hypothetical protein LPJ74_005555 [Coemansia sp. RSA 1843]|nr:hypothetical protein LPJ74_005555 [Coemansia sp. RSA 1843]
MPTMRRSTRGRVADSNNNDTSATEANNWTGVSSPLSSLSTPGSPAEPRDQDITDAEEMSTPKKRERQPEEEISSTTAWRPGKRGRPPKHAIMHQSPVSTSTKNNNYNDNINDSAVNDEDSDEEEAEKDAAGETKIDANGYLQGGREFICPIFRSPFRTNQLRQYVLTMDCCRYMGSRDSYMLFKQHPRMRRVETTQEERDLLAQKRMIPKVTRFRPIALVTARTAFREFGARLVKNGRYIVDDYWEAKCRKEKAFPEGTIIADMNVYHSVEAARAAGMTPGSTRKTHKKPLLRTPSSQSVSGSQQQQHQQQSASSSAVMVNSWVQLEAQHRQNTLTQPSTALTLANALQQPPPHFQYQRQQQQQQQQQQLGMPSPMSTTHMQILQDIGGLDEDEPASPSMLHRPVFRNQRSHETAEAAFDRTVAIHRAQAADDHGFVDGAPLVRSMAGSWARATSLSNKLSRQKQHTDEEGFGPMAYASAKMARDLNASIRLWREDNGCTWVDPHTAIRQVPSSLQPTVIRVQRSNDSKTRVDPMVHFASDIEEDGCDEYPLALLPGQFQAAFPIHRTRFGQSCHQAVQSYAYQWLRQLSIQQQQQHQQQQPQQQHQQRRPTDTSTLRPRKK